jgi:hypothetical protein
MKRALLALMLIFLLTLCTLVTFSCEIVDVNLEDRSGAKVINQQDVVQDPTIHQPVD